MISVSSDFKTARKKTIKSQFLVKITYTDDGTPITIQYDDDLVKTTLRTSGQLGQVVFREIEATVLIDKHRYSLLDKEITVYIGSDTLAGEEWYSLGTFIVSESETNRDKDKMTIIAYDLLMKSNQAYVPTTMAFPTTIYDYTEELLSDIGLTTSNVDFVNSDFVLTEDPYADLLVTYREIFQDVAKISGTIGIVREDDKVYFKSITDTTELLTRDNFIEDLEIEKQYGEINKVILAREPEQDYTVLQNAASILAYGETEYKVTNSLLVDSDRATAITPLYNKLLFTLYYPFNVRTEGLGWYELGDQVKLDNGYLYPSPDLYPSATLFPIGHYKTIITDIELVMEGDLNETLQCIAPSQTKTAYTTPMSLTDRTRDAEINIDKNAANIELKVSEDDVIASINLSPEAITIDAAKVDLNGLVTITNLESDYSSDTDLATPGSTVIDGGNITTGNIQSANYVVDTTGTKISLTDGTIDTKNFKVNSIGAVTTSGIAITSGTLTWLGINKPTQTDLGTWTTKISSTGIYTGTLTASQINVTGIDADKITTGTLSTSRLNSDVITTTNFSAQNISASKITSGTLSANYIDGGTINGSSIEISNKFKLNSTLKGPELTNTSGGFLTMAGTSVNDPWASGINLSCLNGVAFYTGTGVTSSLGTFCGKITASSAGAIFISATGTANINNGTGGKVGIKNITINGSTITGENGGSMYANSNVLLNPKSGYYAYVNSTASATNKIAVSSVGPSSRNVKKNLENIDKDYDNLYSDLQKLELFNYDYKYKGINDKNKDYGFIIDDVEELDTMSKYVTHYDVEKVIDGEYLYPKRDTDKKQDLKEKLQVKEWDRDSYLRLSLTLIKTLQRKIDELEKEIKTMKKELV